MEFEFNKEKFLTRLLIGLAILYFFVGISFNLNIYDEGVGLVGAERVGMGQIPYLDFFTIYAPLNYYLTAGFSLLFGGSVMSPRLLSMIYFVFALFGLHKIVKKANGRKPMFLAGLVMLFTLGYSLFYARPTALALMFSVFALLYFVNQFYENEYLWKDDADEPEIKPKPSAKFAIVSGIFTGLVIITRHFVGLYLLLALTLGMFFALDVSFKKRLFTYFKFLLGVCAIVIPVLIYFLIKVPFAELYRDLVDIPLNVFPQYRGLPSFFLGNTAYDVDMTTKLFNLWKNIFYIIPIAVFVNVLFVFIRAKLKKEMNNRIRAVFPISIFSILLFLQANIRSDIEHFIPAWIFMLLTIFILYDFSTLKIPEKIIIILLLAGFVSMPLYSKYKLIENLSDKRYVKIEKIPRAERFIIDKNWYNSLLPAVEFIRKNTDRKDRIFVCNDRNDKGYRNDVLFYFLSERLPGTRYHELHPGVTTTSLVQNEIVDDLKKNNVRFVVRVYGLNEHEESNLSSVSSGVHILDNYIRDNYMSIARYGMYEILILH